MAPIVGRALDLGVARRNEDQSVAVELAGLPTFLLQRADGGTLYHTRDVATIAYREETYQPTAIVYVVDARQELHFRQLFALSRALGYGSGTDLVHVSFGVVTGSDGQPLAARRGNMVFLQSLLDEGHRRARGIADEASSNLSDVDKDRVAEEVGIGAVIYNDLYQDPRRNISLNWDNMLSLQGNSAPYIQYMYARCRSILRRAVDEGHLSSEGSLTKGKSLAVNPALLNHPAEAALIKHLARLPGAVRESGARYAPFVLAEWCYDSARLISVFYRDCPVLAASSADIRRARLGLVVAAAQALKNGLALLGIAAPEKM
jgi:arginyl-tRNA synthetase